MTTGARPPVRFVLDGTAVEVPDDGCSLLEALRDRLGVRSPKDGCSPQGQCGCCTVLVDGAPRVACVTPARRVAGRDVSTAEGLDPGRRDRWAACFTAAGASQCGFCTPGIIVRLDAEARADRADPERALLAHLCRCTGWRTILDAYGRFVDGDSPPWPGARDPARAARRASLEGGASQVVGPDVALGRAGFADDTAPADALVAVPDGRGGWAVGETLTEARAVAGKTQGRRTSAAASHPLEVPPGRWDRVLRTTWVEPAYLETDASWCAPGGEPASPLANGGAFGGKVHTPAAAAARELADRWGRPVRVLLSREDTVRLGAKRPPIAAGVDRDAGRVEVRVARTAGIAERLAAGVALFAPDAVVSVEEVDVLGPPTSAVLRGAGVAEGVALGVALAGAETRGEAATVALRDAGGAAVTVTVSAGPDAGIDVRVACGDPLDEVVLRSYCVGAVHMAASWVTSEHIATDEAGAPADLTVRSFGILRAVDMPAVRVAIEPSSGPAVNGSDLVFAATAAAVWAAQGYPPSWPTGGRLR